MEDLEVNEIVSFLMWVLNIYISIEMMRNVELVLEVDVGILELLFFLYVVFELFDMYMFMFILNIIVWLWKVLEIDKKDWVKEIELEVD